MGVSDGRRCQLHTARPINSGIPGGTGGSVAPDSGPHRDERPTVKAETQAGKKPTDWAVRREATLSGGDP